MLQKVNPTYVGSDDEVKRWRRVLERSWRGGEGVEGRLRDKDEENRVNVLSDGCQEKRCFNTW